MKTLLLVQASLHSDLGQSSRLAGRFVGQWRQAHPDGCVIVRDLAADPVPHLTAERFAAFVARPESRTPAQARVVDESERLIGELEAADVVVFGLPMYNFGIPSTLKSWIDHVARAGRTFRYTGEGPIGLLADRPVYLFAARGGRYLGTPRDTQTAYMTHLLNFLGLRNIQFVYAEGLAIGAEEQREALEAAGHTIDRLAA